jgi:hypothetical protein
MRAAVMRRILSLRTRQERVSAGAAGSRASRG